MMAWPWHECEVTHSPQDDRLGTGWQIGRNEPHRGTSCHLATMCPLAPHLETHLYWTALSSLAMSGHIHMPRDHSLAWKDKNSLQMKWARTWPFLSLSFKLPTNLTSSPSWGAGWASSQIWRELTSLWLLYKQTQWRKLGGQLSGQVSAKSKTLWLPDVTGQASRAPPTPRGTKSRAKDLLLIHLRVLGINS